MAKITPIDIIKDVSSKLGGGYSKEYFATNKCTLKLDIIIQTPPIDTKFLLCFYSSPYPTSHFLQITYKLPQNSTFLSNKTKFQKNCHTKRVVHLAFNANFADRLKKRRNYTKIHSL